MNKNDYHDQIKKISILFDWQEIDGGMKKRQPLFNKAWYFCEMMVIFNEVYCIPMFLFRLSTPQGEILTFEETKEIVQVNFSFVYVQNEWYWSLDSCNVRFESMDRWITQVCNLINGIKD